MASTQDDVVVRLRLKDVKQFIADVKSGKLAIEDLEQQVKRAGDTAGKVTAQGTGGLSKLASHFGFLAGWARTGALALGAATVGVAGYAVKSAASMEQVSVSMETMLGSASKARAMMADLQKFAVATPFEFGDVAKQAQHLLAFGFAAKTVIPTLTAVGNAASGLSLGPEGLDRIVTALGQMRMKGRVQGDEMLQLAEAGINANAYLERAFHLTPAQLQKAQQAGKISAAAAIPVILRGMDDQFHGLMDKQSHTLSGIWSNFHDALQQNLVKAVNPFLPTIEGWLQRAVDALPGIMTRLQGLITTVTSHVGAWISRAMDVIPYLRSYGGQGADDFGAANIIARLFGDSDGKTVPMIEHLIGVVRNLGTIFSQDVVPALKDFSVVLGLVGPLLAGLDATTGFIAGHSTAFHVALDLVVGSLVAYKLAVWAMNAAIGAYNLVTSWAELKTTGFTKATNAQRLAIVAWKVAVWAATAAQWLWNVALDANPIGATILVIGLLATAFIIAYEKVKPFRDFINGLWGDMRSFADWITNVWNKVMGNASAGPARPAVVGGYAPPATNADGTASGVSTVPGHGMGPVPGHAAGGIMTQTHTAWVGERGPELLTLPRGSAVIPLPRVPEFAGSRAPIHVHVEVDGRELTTVVLNDLNARAARR